MFQDLISKSEAAISKEERTIITQNVEMGAVACLDSYRKAKNAAETASILHKNTAASLTLGDVDAQEHFFEKTLSLATAEAVAEKKLSLAQKAFDKMFPKAEK